MTSSFLQSKEWLEFQKSIGRKIFEYNQEGVEANVVKYLLPFGKSYLYIPHGPRLDFNSMISGSKNPLRNFLHWLKLIARGEKSIFLKIEPQQDNVAQAFAELGFKKSKKNIQPHRTVVLDLEKDNQILLDSMHHKTRYNIKIAEKRGIVVGESDDIKIFLKLLKKTTERDKFSSHPNDYYKKLLNFFPARGWSASGGNDGEIQTKLFLAKLEDKPIAAAIVLMLGDIGYYLHGASDYQYRSQMAPYILHWHIINYLKNNGFKKYDLWGIDANKWPGVTRFKLGWGGRVIEYPGSFDLPISRIWHWLYKVGRSIK